MKVIRDAVLGDIEVEPGLLELLDTSEVQRLRGVKQLGTASLVYPSAVHTRFEHSLGTLQLARRILERLEARAGGPVLSGREREATLASALLHDVTHIPFGHTLEDERRLFDRHDTPERMLRFLRQGELARVLDRRGLRDSVEATLAAVPTAGPVGIMAEIVRGTVGADLLDYLGRDAYFCGFRTTFDERIFRYFVLESGRLALAVVKDGLLRTDALSEVLNLLWLRYALCERVYYHHAKVAAGAAISKAVEIALDRGLEVAELYPLRDEGLFEHLRARFGRSRRLRTLLARIEARRLYKRAYVLTPVIGAAREEELVRRYHFDREARKQAESELARAIRVGSEDVIVYCPAAHMALKEADMPLLVGPRAKARTVPSVSRGPPGAAPAAPDSGVVRLSDLGLPEVEVLRAKHRDLWRFYVFLAPERRERASSLSRACEELFRERNLLDVVGRGPLRLCLEAREGA